MFVVVCLLFWLLGSLFWGEREITAVNKYNAFHVTLRDNCINVRIEALNLTLLLPTLKPRTHEQTTRCENKANKIAVSLLADDFCFRVAPAS